MKTSTFRLVSFLPLSLVLLVGAFIVGIVMIASGEEALDAVMIYVGLCCFMLAVLAWLLLGEVRTKAITVELDADSLSVRGYYGLGSKHRILYSDCSGFTTSDLPTESGQTYEYLYVMQNGKKVVKLSEFYHKNYDELKREIAKKMKYLGDKPFSMSDELMDTIRP